MRPYVLMLLAAGLFMGGLIVSAPTPTEAAQKKKKKKGDEPPGLIEPIETVGRPAKFEQGQEARYALWFDDGLWHLRVTSGKNQRTVFEGRVDVKSGTLAVLAFGLEKAAKADDADWVALLPKQKGCTFHLVTQGELDSLDFRPSDDADEIAFTLRINSDDNPKRIFVGPQGKHPERATLIFPARPVKK